MMFILGGCAYTPTNEVPESKGLTWKVEYHQVFNGYKMELDNSNSNCQLFTCVYVMDVSVLIYANGLAVPHADSKSFLSNMDSKRPFIGTLASGKTIQMVSDCTYYVCSEYPSSIKGQEYVYNELMNGRDVEIDTGQTYPRAGSKMFFPTLGFKEAISELNRLESKPTPLDEAL